MERKVLVDEPLPDGGRFKRIEYTLERGETLPCSTSTKKCYKGPGKVLKEYYPNGCINDVIDEDTCRVGYTQEYLTRAIEKNL